MKETAIIWDLDGTLLDTLEDLMLATNAVLRSYGYPQRTLTEIRSFVGNGARRLLELALPAGSSDALIDEAHSRFKTYYDAHCREHTGPYPGILAALSALRDQGYPMALVSNKPDSAVQILCRDYFGDLFPVCRGEKQGTPRKPAPDMVWQTAEALGVEKEHCIYVGDSEVDILTAKNCGMPCLSVLWGFRDAQMLRENGAAFFCDRPENLPETLKQMEESLYGK